MDNNKVNSRNNTNINIIKSIFISGGIMSLFAIDFYITAHYPVFALILGMFFALFILFVIITAFVYVMFFKEDDEYYRL